MRYGMSQESISALSKMALGMDLMEWQIHQFTIMCMYFIGWGKIFL